MSEPELLKHGEQGCPGCEALERRLDRLVTGLLLAHTWVDRSPNMAKTILDQELQAIDREGLGAEAHKGNRTLQAVDQCARNLRNIADQLDAALAELVDRIGRG